jgi:hypothetical protein
MVPPPEYRDPCFNNDGNHGECHSDPAEANLGGGSFPYQHKEPGSHAMTKLVDVRSPQNDYHHEPYKPKLKLRSTATLHGIACRANPVTRVLAQIGFRPTICDNTWTHITINQLEMLQLHVDGIIIAVHDISPNTYKSEHDYKNGLITMQSVGIGNIPLHRYDLACPHHLSTVLTGTTHSTLSYDRMCMIRIPTMHGA